MKERPKKLKLDLSRFKSVDIYGMNTIRKVIVSVDLPIEDDETESILKRLKVYDYQTIIVPEDVADVLLDMNPACFDGCSDLQIIEKTTED